MEVSVPSLSLSPFADIVFFIFLYQRWIYRVDLKRVNEYGTSGEDELSRSRGGATGDRAAAANGPEPCTDGEIKSPVEKKND